MTGVESDKIGVLMGGYSSERDVSLKSGLSVYESLRISGRNVLAIDIVDFDPIKITSVIKKANIDRAFITLHGVLGEDGQIQRILEDLGISYTGSGIEASEIAIDKACTQRLFLEYQIKVPEFYVVRQTHVHNFDDIWNQIKVFPVVVKPSREGSSLGITIVHSKENFHRALKYALDFGCDVLVERYIKGREFTVSILHGRALPIVEVLPKSEYFDFRAKYEKGNTQYSVPASLPRIIQSSLQSTALKAHRLLRCEDFSRVDFILDEDLRHYVLEINTIPGFTETSLLPKAAYAEGITFNQLCLQLVSNYGEKKERKCCSNVSN